LKASTGILDSLKDSTGIHESLKASASQGDPLKPSAILDLPKASPRVHDSEKLSLSILDLWNSPFHSSTNFCFEKISPIDGLQFFLLFSKTYLPGCCVKCLGKSMFAYDVFKFQTISCLAYGDYVIKKKRYLSKFELIYKILR
jgi:hypothetical protein